MLLGGFSVGRAAPEHTVWGSQAEKATNPMASGTAGCTPGEHREMGTVGLQ